MLRVGLTLSGGGSRGAYEVGVLRALAERNIRLHAISGASIGALNGAVVAAAPSLHDAADRLEALWKMLGEHKPIPDRVFLNMAGAAGAQLIVPDALRQLLALCGPQADPFDDFNDDGLLSNRPLRDILETYIADEALEKGIPFYVSLYEKNPSQLKQLYHIFPPHAQLLEKLCTLPDILSHVAELWNTRPSDYVCIQKLPLSQRRKALLASAAFPYVFASQHMAGCEWIDGGTGDSLGETGNTPTDPLVAAGCDLIIVVLLKNGAYWDRTRSPQTTFLEIRPSGQVPGIRDLLNFSDTIIGELYEMGYKDATRTLQHCEALLKQAARRQSLTNAMNTAFAEEQQSRAALDTAMQRLKAAFTSDD